MASKVSSTFCASISTRTNFLHGARFSTVTFTNKPFGHELATVGGAREGVKSGRNTVDGIIPAGFLQGLVLLNRKTASHARLYAKENTAGGGQHGIAGAALHELRGRRLRDRDRHQWY